MRLFWFGWSVYNVYKLHVNKSVRNFWRLFQISDFIRIGYIRHTKIRKLKFFCKISSVLIEFLIAPFSRSFKNWYVWIEEPVHCAYSCIFFRFFIHFSFIDTTWQKELQSGWVGPVHCFGLVTIKDMQTPVLGSGQLDLRDAQWAKKMIGVFISRLASKTPVWAPKNSKKFKSGLNYRQDWNWPGAHFMLRRFFLSGFFVFEM